MEPHRPIRRWYRFSLRTLLVLVTLICIYLGWAMNWKWQRHEFLRRVRTDIPEGITVSDARAYSPLADQAPFPLRMLGEYGYVNLFLPNAREEDCQLAVRLFPEARVYSDYFLDHDHSKPQP